MLLIRHHVMVFFSGPSNNNNDDYDRISGVYFETQCKTVQIAFYEPSAEVTAFNGGE